MKRAVAALVLALVPVLPRVEGLGAWKGPGAAEAPVLTGCPFNLHACSFELLPHAAQKVYQKRGVPHTDRDGRRRTAYDSNASFFPLGLYHALVGSPAPINCNHPKRDCNYSLDFVAEGGFNTVHLWEGIHLDQGLAGAGGKLTPLATTPLNALHGVPSVSINVPRRFNSNVLLC